MWSFLIPGPVRAILERRQIMREVRQIQQDEAWEIARSDANPLHRAKMSLQADDPKSALAYWNELWTRYPEYAATAPDTIEVLLGLRLFDEAETLMRQGQQRFPREGRYAEGYAATAERRRDWDEAIRRWAAVRKKFPGRPAGYMSGAACLREVGRLDDADALIAQAMPKFPKSVACWLESGRIGDARRDWTDAQRRWEELEQRFGHNAGMVGAVRAMMETGRLEEAEATLIPARVKYPIEVSIPVMLAQIAERRGDIPLALERWAVVREKFPRHMQGYVETVRLMRAAGQFGELDAVIQQAIHTFPTDAWPLVEHASLATQQKDWDAAASRWQAVRDAYPDREDGYLRGAEALDGLGNTAGATDLRAEWQERRRSSA